MKQIILYSIIYPLLLSVLYPDQTDKMINDLISGENRYSFNQMEAQAKAGPLESSKTIILKGLLEIDGKKSFSFFKEYIEKNQNGDYTNLALSRVADYYYTEGLYTQSSQWYKKILFNSKNKDNLIPSINYFINSLAVSGRMDSAKYYTKLLKNEYPDLNFNTEFYSERNNPLASTKGNKQKYSEKSYYVQIGLYERYGDATYHRSILLSSGFLSRIDEILDNNNKLYALRVGYYSDIQKAENIKRRMRSRLGLTNLEIIELK